MRTQIRPNQVTHHPFCPRAGKVTVAFSHFLSPLTNHKQPKTQPPWCHCGLPSSEKSTLYHATLFVYKTEKPICRSPAKKCRMVWPNVGGKIFTPRRNGNWSMQLMWSPNALGNQRYHHLRCHHDATIDNISIGRHQCLGSRLFARLRRPERRLLGVNIF